MPLHHGVALLDELMHEQVRVSGGPFLLDAATWAIHGFIPVDGDVILATFQSRLEAEVAITRLWAVGATNEPPV